MIKRLALFAVSLLVVATLAGCADGKKAKLKETVEEVDKMCPINMGTMGDLIDVRYDEDVNEVQYYYSINENGLYNIGLINENRNFMSTAIRLQLSKSELKKVLEFMVDVKARLKVVYKSASSGKSTDITIYPYELREVLDSPMSDKDVNEMLLKNEIAVIKKSLPMDVEEGMAIDDVYEDGDNVVYKYLLDENLYSISLLRRNVAVMKPTILESFKSDLTVKQLISVLVALDKGLVYRYVGGSSGDSVDLAISLNELREFLRDNPVRVN